MKKWMILTAPILIMLLTIFPFVNASTAIDIHKIDDVLEMDIGGNWEFKVTSYDEVKHSMSPRSKKHARVFGELRNISDTIQKTDRSDWNFYLIGADESSYKAENMYRHPGKEWWGRRDEVLPGAPYPVRIIFDIPLEFEARRVLISGAPPSAAQATVVVTEGGRVDYVPPPKMSEGLRRPEPPRPGHDMGHRRPPGPERHGIPSAEEQAKAGYGLVFGHSLGLSGKYWAMDQWGGQVILARRGVSTVGINARLLFKALAIPMGNVYLAPEVGYNFNALGGTISGSSYGIVGGAEFIMPLPAKIAAGRRHRWGDGWISFFGGGKAKAVGISFEAGFFGTGITTTQSNQHSPGFNMAGHIYL